MVANYLPINSVLMALGNIRIAGLPLVPIGNDIQEIPGYKSIMCSNIGFQKEPCYVWIKACFPGIQTDYGFHDPIILESLLF